MVWRWFVAAALAFVFGLPLIAGTAWAQRPGGPGWGGSPEWEQLGTVRIRGARVDREVVKVGRDDGRFTRIGIEARRGSPYLVEIKVVYGNNEVERFDLRRRLDEGARKALDLKGRDRAIKRIEIAARSGGPGARRFVSEIGIWGEQVKSDWELLGRKDVGFKVDRDVIKVGRREGRFEKVALEVKDADVEIRSFKVFFDRGPPQDVDVRQVIPAGGRTRPIDLAGRDRVIDRIELVYRSRRPGPRNRAEVLVYGLQADRGPGRPGPGPGPRPGPGPGPRGGWEELGCEGVGIKADHDSIKVGRREGRFSAIQLRVRGNDVNIIDLKVIYNRGPADDIRVRSLIREGGETRPLDLRGERRVIERIDMTYKIPLGVNLIKGPATVCVYGR